MGRESSLLQYNRISYILIAFSVGLCTMIDLPLQLFAKDVLKIEPALMSQLIAFISIAWIIKPFFGLLTDLYPLFGYRRKIYIFICSFIISSCLMLLAYANVNIWHTAMILLILNTGLSFIMVVGEAIVVQLSQQEDQSKIQDQAKNLISIFFLFRYLGNLFASLLKGFLVESVGIRNVFLIASFTGVIIFISGIIFIEERLGNDNKHITKNDYEERLVGLNENITFEDTKENLKTEKIKDLNIMESNKKVILTEFLNFLFKRNVYIPVFFILIYIGTPSLSSPIFYFLSNTLKFVPSDFGLISFFSNTFILFSIVIYRFFLKNCNFKVLITIGTIASFIITLLTYFVVTRANVYWGISDFLMCLACSSLLSGLGEIILLPMLSLGCDLCPKYLEATVYSFFMSTINLGGIISELSGSFLISYYGITSTNFENLPKMIIVTNFISILPLVLFFIIDNKYFHPEEKDNLRFAEELLTKDKSNKDMDKTPNEVNNKKN